MDHTEITKDIEAALADPFDPTEVGLLPKGKKGDRQFLAMPYIDARSVQDRLDAVVGSKGWQDTYHHIPGSAVAVVCRLTVLGVTKEGIGEAKPGGADELFKSAESDALKRAAVKFGVGRYLYSLDAQFLAFNGRSFTEGFRFPGWALPGGDARPPVKPPTPKPVEEKGEQPRQRQQPKAEAPSTAVTKDQRTTMAKLLSDLAELDAAASGKFGAKIEACPDKDTASELINNLQATIAKLKRERRDGAAPAAAPPTQAEDPYEEVFAAKSKSTPEQHRKIAELQEKLVTMGKTPDELATELHELFGVANTEALTKSQASRLIDDYRSSLNGLYLTKRRELAEVPPPPAKTGGTLPKAAAL